MPYQELQFLPGVYTDDSAIAAKNHFTAADKMRFVRGRPQTVGGWEKFSSTALTGIARGMHTWADRTKNPYLAVATHLRDYASDVDGNITDITPVVTYGTLTNPFTTTISTTTISVAHTAHGLIVDQLVRFPYLTGTVNGATITAATRYAVVSITDANNFTFAADTVASSSGAATTGVTDYQYGLAPGQVDGLGGAGYGTGGYGSGGYGSNNSVTLYPRTTSFAEWGANVVFNPRGGPIFEWAPNTTATELLTNAFLTAQTGWTVGQGWSLSGSGGVGSVASGALTQPITLSVGAWHQLHFAVTSQPGGTALAGSFYMLQGSSTIANCSAVGHYNTQFFVGAGGAVVFTVQGTAFAGKIKQINLNVLTTGQQITSAPNPATCVFATAERALVACGVNDANGNFNAMRVAWSDRENNQLWTTGPSNLAGANNLSNGSRIVTAKPGRGENLIWTDKALYAMRWSPDPNVVYDFIELGDKCGCIGAQAAVVINGVAYWMAPSGETFMYAGGLPTPLLSTIRQDTFNNLAWVQQDKIAAFSNNGWSEAWWLYPDIRDGNECSRYNQFNFAENCWAPGTFSRSAWTDAGVFQYPIAVDTSGYLWYHEKGYTQDGGTRSWSLTGAALELGSGDQHIRTHAYRPDPKLLQGGYQISIIANWRDIRGKFSKTYGPFNATAMTGKIAVRAKSQVMQIQWSATDAPTFWRMGVDAIDIENAGERR